MEIITIEFDDEVKKQRTVTSDEQIFLLRYSVKKILQGLYSLTKNS